MEGKAKIGILRWEEGKVEKGLLQLEELPGNSTVLIYLGEEKPTDLVTVPDLIGLTQYQAESTINSTGGLYMQTRGSKNQSGSVAVSAQDIPPGTEVERGTTVTVELTDSSARD